MREDVNSPDIAFPTDVRGFGTLSAAGRSVPITRFMLTRAKYEAAEPWLFVGEIQRTDVNRVHDIVVSRADITFQGETDLHKRLIIRDLNWTGTSNYTVNGEAYSIDVEAQPQVAAPTRAWLNVGFSETNIARSEKMHELRPRTGEIVGDRDMAPLRVTLDLGTFEFSRQYTFERAHTSGLSALVRIDRPAMGGELVDPSLAQNPGTLFDSLSDGYWISLGS